MPSRFRGFLRGRRAAGLDRAVLSALTIAGLALRVPGIALQPLQWDEGWSIALGRLGVGDALRLTALDVHPPLYYLALRAWLAAAGATPFALRGLSALVGALAVPLAAAAARAWWPEDGGRRWVGWVAALATALSPPLVYYGGVGRMYAPARVGVLAAAWGLGRGPAAARWASRWRRRRRAAVVLLRGLRAGRAHRRARRPPRVAAVGGLGLCDGGGVRAVAGVRPAAAPHRMSGAKRHGGCAGRLRSRRSVLEG
ncbi:MAG: hypothetical protein U0470_06660 [Anaerolineae bacterium]